MIWHWTGLVFFSLTLLPAGLALVSGRIPRQLRHRLAPLRPRGLALLALYAVAPLNTVPRLAEELRTAADWQGLESVSVSRWGNAVDDLARAMPGVRRHDGVAREPVALADDEPPG